MPNFPLKISNFIHEVKRQAARHKKIRMSYISNQFDVSMLIFHVINTWHERKIRRRKKAEGSYTKWHCSLNGNRLIKYFSISFSCALLLLEDVPFWSMVDNVEGVGKAKLKWLLSGRRSVLD